MGTMIGHFPAFLNLITPSLSLPINQKEPSYVSGPDGRGTVGLLWSCSITSGLCIWTVVHPNVIPWPRFWDQAFYKMNWMIGAVFFPELLVCLAIGQYWQARKVLRCWREQFHDSEVKDWLGKPGAFFVVMGGFVLGIQPHAQSPPDMKGPCADTRPSLEQDVNEWGVFYQRLNRGDLVTTIQPAGFCQLLREEWFKVLIKAHGKAYFFHRSIADKGKADNIAKSLVFIQILWMCIQCLGRKLSGLPVTLLEGHVLIQIVFAVVAYFFWWDKPLDVAEPISFPIRLNEIRRYIRPRTEFSSCPYFITTSTNRGGFFRMLCRAVYDTTCYNPHWLMICATSLAMVNGGLHAVAWCSHFPTGTEQLLWRISCLGAGLLFPLLLGVFWKLQAELHGVRVFFNITVSQEANGPRIFATEFGRFWKDVVEGARISQDNQRPPWLNWVPRWARNFVLVMVCLLAFAYMACLLGITVESFLSMRSLPKGAYSTFEWAEFSPHI